MEQLMPRLPYVSSLGSMISVERDFYSLSLVRLDREGNWAIFKYRGINTLELIFDIDIEIVLLYPLDTIFGHITFLPTNVAVKYVSKRIFIPFFSFADWKKLGNF